MARSSIYLDHAAATPVDPAVLAAMQPFFTQDFYNASASYVAARQVRQAFETARTDVAQWLSARSSEIIFTAGGTEANNLAIHGIMRQFPKGNLVVGAIEHESVLEPAGQYDVRRAKVDAAGRVDLKDLVSKIDDQTVLVSIMYANNEIGTIQPIGKVGRLVHDIRGRRGSGAQPLFLHTDAAQAANYLDLHVSRLGVDMMTLNGGKIYGPKQSGVLYVKAGVQLLPLISGGGQERGLRSGTESPAAAVGFAKALRLAQTMRKDEAQRLDKLQKTFFELVESKLPQAIINGPRRHRLPNNIHLTLPGHDNERLLIQLDQAGVLAAAGSACNAASGTPSHVLKALGLTDETARSSLRFTKGRSTTLAMIEQTVQLLYTYY